jgi:hypothetical protein
MDSNSFKGIPVLLIGYSRIDHIRRCIVQLQNLGITTIFLSLDFSEDASIRHKQQILLEELGDAIQRDGFSVVVWQRTRNHGVGVGVITALDWFFHFNEKGIVLEDDLVFDENFLEFCSIAFEKYQNVREILMVSGNRFDDSSIVSGVVATNYPQIWGWASTRDKWLDIRMLILEEKRMRIGDVLNPKIAFFYSGAKLAQIGRVDTWDTPLAYEMLIRKKMCVLPDFNLVENIGVDQYAAHTRESSFPLNFPIMASRIKDKSQLPTFDELELTTGKTNLFLERAVFKIKKRHVLSPLKLWVRSRGRSESKSKSLRMRLEEAETFVR